MSGTFTVTPGLPDDWPTLTRMSPAVARERSILSGQSWYPGKYHTFALRAANGDCLVALGGTVLNEPGPVARRDPYHILSGGGTYMGLVADGPHAWRDVPPGELFPCLMLMFPYYGTFPVGIGSTDPVTLRRFVAELIDWGKKRGVRSAAFLYLTPRAKDLMAELTESGFSVATLTERCDLHVTWTDLEGYLRTLPGKRRIEVRRELRHIEDRGSKLIHRPLAADEPELLDLRCRLVNKYDGSADPAAEAETFNQIRRNFDPDDITVFALTHDNRILSFALFVQDDEEWTAMLVGSDYSTRDSSLGYFATLFYHPVVEAPARGVKTIAYGHGSLAAKRRRGCKVSLCYAAELRL